MGYMQEIIRRGNVKYFISQRQKDVNKPIDDIGDIGTGSAWYVQEERPYVIQGVLYQEGVNFIQDVKNIMPSFLSDTVFFSFWKAILIAVEAQSLGECVNSLLVKAPTKNGNEESNMCVDFLASGYSFQTEVYNNNFVYLNILDRQNSDKKAKCGIRADTINKIIYLGILGKIYFPAAANNFLKGSFNAREIQYLFKTTKNTTYFSCSGVFGGWAVIKKLEQVLLDVNIRSAQNFFAELPGVQQNKISFQKWTFRNCSDFNYMFLGSFAAPSVNIYTTIGDIKHYYWGHTGSSEQSFMIQSWKNAAQKTTELDLSSFNTKNASSMRGFFKGQGNCFGYTPSSPTNGTSTLKKVFVSDSFVVDQVLTSAQMFNYRGGLTGGAGTVWSSSNPTDKTYAHWDEGPSNPGYFWNPNVMDPLILVPGPQFNTAWLAAVNAAAAAAGSDRVPSIQQITGEFTFVPMSSKPANLQTLPNNDVKESGEGEAYIGYTYNIADRSFKVYLVSDNIGEGNIKANPNCTDMFALDSTVPGSLTMNIEWLNTSQVTNMENMFGIKEV